MAQAGDDPSTPQVPDLPPAATATPATGIISKMVATCTAASPVSITPHASLITCHKVFPWISQFQLHLLTDAFSFFSFFFICTLKHIDSLPFFFSPHSPHLFLLEDRRIFLGSATVHLINTVSLNKYTVLVWSVCEVYDMIR